MLRDRLVNGESIHKKLLAARNLTFDEALAIARGSEEADRNLREMRAPKNKVGVGVVVKQELVHQLQASGSSKRRSTAGRNKGTPAGALVGLDTLLGFADSKRSTATTVRERDT